MNQVFLVGRLGQKPVLRYTPSGMTVLNFSLATDKNKKNGDKWEKITSWHNVTIFGRTAESLSQRLDKGALIAATGELDYSEYTDKSGSKRQKTSIIVSNVKVLDNGKSQTSSEPAQRTSAQTEADDFISSLQQRAGTFTESDIPF